MSLDDIYQLTMDAQREMRAALPCGVFGKLVLEVDCDTGRLWITAKVCPTDLHDGLTVHSVWTGNALTTSARHEQIDTHLIALRAKAVETAHRTIEQSLLQTVGA